MKKLACVISIALAAAACGDDGGGATDAGPDAPIDTPTGNVCAAPVTTLTTYPATFTGATIGAGADVTVAMGACADEQGYFGDSGEDQVIALTGLTAGSRYVVELATNEDLSMYVATACDGAGPATDACILHVDQQFTTEVGEFDAPASGAVFIIVDAPDGTPPATGAYTLSVHTSECDTDAQCLTPGEPVCINQACVACGTAFDCTTAGAPLCDGATHACVAGGAACTGDDAGEPDDGPAAARPLTFPTLATPTTIAAAVCSSPATERDWYSFVATGAGAVRVAATWTAADTDLDFRVHDSTGVVVGSGLSTDATSEIRLINLSAAGTYYLVINQFGPAGAAAATPYMLTLAIPECQDSFDCTLAGTPVCDAGGTCIAGAASCTGDDVGEPDDGPAAARTLNGLVGTPQTRTGAVCNTPGTEFDFYRVDVLQGEGITINLAWPSADDLDIAAFDSQGRALGLAFWLKPEVVTLTYLPAGAYYFRIGNASAASAVAVAYTITATKTAAQVCVTRADCASTYSNQFYRGACTLGACQFIAPGAGADGALCDSFDDCTSGSCSYSVFEADAQDSVCTHSCATTADCAALGAGFACTTGFQTNFCFPTCTSDLECGADTGSSTVTTGQPWDYFTCTVATGACSP